MKEGIDFLTYSPCTDLRFKGLQNYDQLLIDVIL